jgi:hypothetical protein
MNEKSAQFLQAAVGMMMAARPVEGKYRVELQADGEYRVVSDTEDFWEDGMVYEHEANIVMSLCNLGLYSIHEMCEILTAVERLRPDLCPSPEQESPAAKRAKK